LKSISKNNPRQQPAKETKKMELPTIKNGNQKIVYDFKCPCGYICMKDELKAKDTLKRLHLKKCVIGQEAVRTGQHVTYWNDTQIRLGGLSRTTGDSTRGGRQMPTESFVNNLGRLVQ